MAPCGAALRGRVEWRSLSRHRWMGLRRPAAASTVSGPAAAFLIPHRPPWVLRFGAQYQPAPLVLINGSAKSGCLPRAGGRIAGKPPGPGLGCR